MWGLWRFVTSLTTCRLTCTDRFPNIPTKLGKSIIGGGAVPPPPPPPCPPAGYASGTCNNVCADFGRLCYSITIMRELYMHYQSNDRSLPIFAACMIVSRSLIKKNCKKVSRILWCVYIPVHPYAGCYDTLVFKCLDTNIKTHLISNQLASFNIFIIKIQSVFVWWLF